MIDFPRGYEPHRITRPAPLPDLPELAEGTEARHRAEFIVARARLLGALLALSFSTRGLWKRGEPRPVTAWRGLGRIVASPRGRHAYLRTRAETMARLGVPFGWAIRKLPDRDAYVMAPAWILWPLDRLEYALAWSIDVGVRQGWLELKPGGWYRDVRPRGWAVASCYLRRVWSRLEQPITWGSPHA